MKFFGPPRPEGVPLRRYTLYVMIVQPPSCATPADVDLSIRLISRRITVDDHLQRVDILPGFQL